jgi:type II secretory pathway component PulM
MSLRDSLDGLLDRVRDALSGLTARDRALLSVLVAAVVLTFGLFVTTAIGKREKAAAARLAAIEQAQAQVNLLLSRYTELSGEVAALDAELAESKELSPASWLEQLGNEMGLSASIKSINERGVEEQDFYKAEKVEVAIDDIDLRQTVDILYRIETAPQAMRVQDLRVKADRQDRSKLDVRVELAVLKPVEG